MKTNEFATVHMYVKENQLSGLTVAQSTVSFELLVDLTGGAVGGRGVECQFFKEVRHAGRVRKFVARSSIEAD